ncbi:MAG: aminotransferase class I/II-fold pyridoxal phosphate-dependent enzyme [Melioribacteraceae bacterium]|nr:aminotransferase class I/II-fold pyridoxal phosphate-dependent enzyme [Melioribacteraceae bacterium]
MNSIGEILRTYFRLRPLKQAKVSEISEATAASSLPPNERVNFHIGNPVMDEELVLKYLSYVLDIGNSYDLKEYNPDEIAEILDLDTNKFNMLDLFYESIKKSSPYLPRGGFNRTNPNELVKIFHKWLCEEQQEPLTYDLGEKSGKRELIICSGGKWEALRVFMHSLNDYFLLTPVNVLFFNLSVPDHLKNFKHLKIHNIDVDEAALIKFLRDFTSGEKTVPLFLVLGDLISEETRRELRSSALKSPLLFVEFNDAINQHSLAREAGLQDIVLRFLSPAVFNRKLKKFPLTFAAGNADYLKVVETTHFQLKGTPSASEVELLTYLCKNQLPVTEEKQAASDYKPETIIKAGANNILHETSIVTSDFINRIERITASAGNIAQKISDKGYAFTDNLSLLKNRFLRATDSFAHFDAFSLMEKIINQIDDKSMLNELADNFATVFAANQTMYDSSKLSVVSGSSRTALSLLGFHCGVEEVISCDLSWTYEHCFPKTTIVPLTDDYEMDTEKIIRTVSGKIENRLKTDNIAFAINNPHNATGKIFESKNLKNLICWLLENDVFIIDDLAYQNVLPENSIIGPKTVKQYAIDLMQEGRITGKQIRKVITVHSLSKTDGFAGARLTVVEIPDSKMNEKFNKTLRNVKLNIMAVFLAYLFYRNRKELIDNYWLLRNNILGQRLNALLESNRELPSSRNPFDIKIIPPQGGMYPRMEINKLPDGLSLDWLSSGLASQGIGLVPLSTFARSSKGFELGRIAFRLTLGGSDNCEQLLTKTRRVLIDLNRIIAEEKTKYNRIELSKRYSFNISTNEKAKSHLFWNNLITEVAKDAASTITSHKSGILLNGDKEKILHLFIYQYLPQRLRKLEVSFNDQIEVLNATVNRIRNSKKSVFADELRKEFYKDNLGEREERFKKRIFDRTVHPTQIYSIELDAILNYFVDNFIRGKQFNNADIRRFSNSLINEYLGTTVAINSIEESDELIYDLRSHIQAELFSNVYTDSPYEIFLSFWGDWDGSSRPSGQGHRLVAATVLENVSQLAEIVKIIHSIDKSVTIDTELIEEITGLPNLNKEFWNLLNEITALTNQLEKRYRSVLPFSIESGRIRRLGVKLGVAKDPLTRLWQHNDSLEQRMLNLRLKRRERLEFYFRLNKKLRKALFNLIPAIISNSGNNDLLFKAASYRDLLKRFVLTPRIHQKLITANDQFSINTTVYNLTEINEISGKYGNPGMVMGLQVSMSTTPESLISLERKLSSERQRVLNNNPGVILPHVWCIPLLEDIDTVRSVDNYLDKIWNYAAQSRGIDQDTGQRFSQIICEVFIAGSDLSQQVGQTASWDQYNRAKYKIAEWLAKRGLAKEVRMKLGSGEPMQRQGGYYADFSGKPAFVENNNNEELFRKHLRDSTIKSTEFARTPLHGVMARGDLQTFQSNVSEKIRRLTLQKRADLFYHVQQSQKNHLSELERASEPFMLTRLKAESRNLQEIKRITIGKTDEVFDSFVEITKKNFRNILYGTEEDVLGIHVVSYFISRTTPTLRDRPTVRPSQNMGGDKSQKILERIASTIPLSKHGSLLRAIGHNKAQTMILGINQLTTGLFRSLKEFSQKEFTQGKGFILLSDKIMPRLPVYEILITLRNYHDRDLLFFNRMQSSFPAGLTSFSLLREDIDSFEEYIPLMQKELLRRHGVAVAEFFNGDNFIPELLPTLRPDLAVLLQPDLFNTDSSAIFNANENKIESGWLGEFNKLLSTPLTIAKWREKIWALLEAPVKAQVKSFVELAIALNSLSKDAGGAEFNLSSGSIKKVKYETSLSDLLRGKVDDSMRQFLSAAVHYLTRLPDEVVEVPIDIVRALKEVERLLRIEEQALDKKQQELLNFYILQIARLVGESG